MKSNTYEIFNYKDVRSMEVPLHCHNFYEIYLFINGQVNYRVGPNEYKLSPTDLLIMPPDVFHQPLISNSRAYERIVLWINKSYLHSIIDNDRMLNCFKCGKYIINTSETFGVLDYILKQLIIERNKGDEYEDIYTKSLLLSLLIEINRLSKNNTYGDVVKGPNSIIDKVLLYIDDNYNKEINLESIARCFYINKYYLSHLFTQEMGTSIYQYILKKRLVYARELLENGTNPNNACIKAGFGDYTNFYRTFKNEYDVTPKHYYKKFKSKEEVVRYG